MPAYSIDDTGLSRWVPTTFRTQGKNEEYLERLIAGDPLALGLDPYLTGLGINFAAYRQTRLDSPNVRSLRPDVVLLSETGHVVVVEVKLEDNSEIRDRRVISQIVDYAAAVANLDEDALVAWLGESDDTCWLDVVGRAFPKAHDLGRLAAALSDRITRADIHLVIACDSAPLGLRETIKLVSAQSALGDFQLHLVELTPYVNVEEPGRLLIIPNEVARTEIVSRTAVTVRYEGGTGVGVTVVASSPAELKDAIRETKSGRTMRAEFESLLDAFDLEVPDGLKTSGVAPSYRSIRVPGWPGLIHYEFLDRSGEPASVGVELHVESTEYSELCDIVEGFVPSLSAEFSDVSFSRKWFKGCRLVILVPFNDPGLAVRAMSQLIAQTRAPLQAYLDGLAVQQV